MRSLVSKALLIGGAALTALAIGTGSASAATTFTVAAGSAPAGTTVAVTGATTGTSPQVTFKDTTKNTTLTCASSTAKGSTKTGTALSGTAIASINGAATLFNTCKGPFGLTFKVTGANTWKLNATSGSTTGANGTLTGVTATVDGGTSCKFSVTGTVAGTYTNSTKALSFPGTTSTLTISNVVGGCFGAIASGDKASFKASYLLTATTAAYNPVKITSP